MKLEINRITTDSEQGVTIVQGDVQAGFPSPAQGEYGDVIDLNAELINHPETTFCARVIGTSMKDAGINEGDLIIIDRSLQAESGSIAVCFLDGDFTVKRVIIKSDGVYLAPANDRFPEIKVMQSQDFRIWGVVTHIIKKITL